MRRDTEILNLIVTAGQNIDKYSVFIKKILGRKAISSKQSRISLLRGSPPKNRTLDFRCKRDFLDFFCTELLSYVKHIFVNSNQGKIVLFD